MYTRGASRSDTCGACSGLSLARPIATCRRRDICCWRSAWGLAGDIAGALTHAEQARQLHDADDGAVYRRFSIPLLRGWLDPSRADQADEALSWGADRGMVDPAQVRRMLVPAIP